MFGPTTPPVPVLQADGIIPRGSRVEVFESIYSVFLILGTLVGIVVIGYMLYNAYKYRARGEAAEKDRKVEEVQKPDAPSVDRPQVGELPRGSGGGRKLFLSFGLSAIIVISLIAWAYGILLYVEEGAAEEPPTEQAEALEVEVVGYQFGWRFIYPNGHVVDSGAGESFKVPADRMIELNVTSDDVFHNFGIPELRVKSDAIPGQYTNTWFIAEEPGETYTARCFELCGALHSEMTAQVEVMEPDEWEAWNQAVGEIVDSEQAVEEATTTVEDAEEQVGDVEAAQDDLEAANAELEAADSALSNASDAVDAGNYQQAVQHAETARDHATTATEHAEQAVDAANESEGSFVDPFARTTEVYG